GLLKLLGLLVAALGLLKLLGLLVAALGLLVFRGLVVAALGFLVSPEAALDGIVLLEAVGRGERLAAHRALAWLGGRRWPPRRGAHGAPPFCALRSGTRPASSSSVQSNASARRTAMSSIGVRRPVSHLRTASLPTSAARASFSCVKPARSRSSLSR